MSIEHRPRDTKGRFLKTRAAPVMDDVAIVILELDRKTGRVRIDAEFATPAETGWACWRAYQQCDARADDVEDG